MTDEELYNEEQLNIQKEIKKQLEGSAIIPLPRFPEKMKAQIVNEVTAKITGEIEVAEKPFKDLSKELATEIQTMTQSVVKAVVDSMPKELESVKVSNLKEAKADEVSVKNLSLITKEITKLAKTVIENKPVVNVEKQVVKFPKTPKDYISVRLTDGKEFYKPEGGGSSAIAPVDDPLAGYLPSDQDIASNPRYFGFVTSRGAWYIMEENTTNGTYRYSAGKPTPGGLGGGLYTDAWTDRANLTYDYFYEVF